MVDFNDFSNRFFFVGLVWIGRLFWLVLFLFILVDLVLDKLRLF